MIKNNLATLLHNYSPIIQEEIEFKQRMLVFMQEHDNCFERSLEIGHFTASCWLLNKEGNNALLMHHTKLNQWFQLGGHCDGNSDVLRVAIKEAQEESGIQQIIAVNSTIFDIDIHLIPENKHEKAHYHYDIRFLLQVISDEKIIQNRESRALKWISKDKKTLPLVNESVMRMFNKWLNF